MCHGLPLRYNNYHINVGLHSAQHVMVNPRAIWLEMSILLPLALQSGIDIDMQSIVPMSLIGTCLCHITMIADGTKPSPCPVLRAWSRKLVLVLRSGWILYLSDVMHFCITYLPKVESEYRFCMIS